MPKEWIDNPKNLSMNYVFWVTMLKPGILSGYNSDKQFVYFIKNTDNMPTTELDILEETSYSLIFKCPNRVIKDIENCALYISIDDEVYEVPLQ